jgi:peroxiredoxin Q/BCP
MSRITLGEVIPDFTAEATSGRTVTSAGLKGKYVVVYFYPKDNTAGCIQEGLDFSHLYPQFVGRNTEIVGISRDSLKSHENFKARQGFPFDLISDKDESLCRLFDVIQPKMMYGKQVVGIERSTFLLDPEGRLVKEWRKVSVKGHAEKVLDVLIAITGA